MSLIFTVIVSLEDPILSLKKFRGPIVIIKSLSNLIVTITILHGWLLEFGLNFIWITSLTINLNMFENFPTAEAPSGFSNATKVCPGES